MRYTRPDLFDMIESLSLEEKKSLLGYLSDSIREMEASATKMTYLEERWMEIKTDQGYRIIRQALCHTLPE